MVSWYCTPVFCCGVGLAFPTLVPDDAKSRVVIVCFDESLMLIALRFSLFSFSIVICYEFVSLTLA